MAANLPTGTILNGRYEILRVLSAKGGMALIYHARVRGTKREVAIKRNRDPSADSRAQFKIEANMLRSLNHSNLVRVEDDFEDPIGVQFLVMEFIPGSDLGDWMKHRSRPADERQVIEWASILCNVLDYLHKQNPPIIHRDLKADNVKIKPDGTLVLVDFGIAKVFKSGQKTMPGARAVTDGYAPIEQYGAGTDQRTDLYSLGALLYFLLTTQVPEKALERLQNPSLDWYKFNPNVHPQTIAVVTKALGVKPPDRFQTAQAMHAALLAAQNALASGMSGTTQPCLHCNMLNRATAAFCASCGRAMPTMMPLTSGINCMHCGTRNKSTARFCQRCGTSLTSNVRAPTAGVTCMNCGASNRSTSKFCMRCGYPLVSHPTPPPAPIRPPLQPVVQFPLAVGMCPSCGYANAPTETFCFQCGYALQSVLIPRPSALQPNTPLTPVPSLAGPLPEQRTVGWILFAVGFASVAFALWLFAASGPGSITAVLLALGIFTAIAGRDLLDLFDSYRNRVPFWLAPAFGDAMRGQRSGAIAATLWVMVGCATAWLIIPLAIASAMAFALNILISERFAQSIGAKHTRPGWVVVIGWLLALSIVGTIPGIALLFPKRWAKEAANIALTAMGFIGALGVMISLANLGALPGSLPIDWTVPGTNISALAVSGVTSSLSVFAGAIAGLRYLQTAQLNPSTGTARRRELHVAAWTLLGTGAATLLITFAWANKTPWQDAAFWFGISVSALAIVGARDMLELWQSQLTNIPLVAGSMARGRRLGVISACALTVACAAFAWLGVPVFFLIVAIFLLYELMSIEAMVECGENPHAPRGVTLIGWALLPTCVGTLPGIEMLRGEAIGWRWSRPVLGLCAMAGIILAGWASSGNVSGSFQSATLVSLGLAMTVGSVLALVYVNQPIVRKYFHV